MISAPRTHRRVQWLEGIEPFDLDIAIHFAESWHDGGLIRTLERLELLVRNGVIDQLDNANALFATNDFRSLIQRYSDPEWQYIAKLQRNILGLLMEREIGLVINPTSNDWLTRTLRKKEGWRFRELTEPLTDGFPSVVEFMIFESNRTKPLVMSVGNDNSRIYPSRVEGLLTVSEELASL